MIKNINVSQYQMKSQLRKICLKSDKLEKTLKAYKKQKV